MPIRHSIIHQIDKKPDGSPAALHVSSTELVESQTTENLLNDFNEAYNAKTGKAWGLFHAESGAYPFSGRLRAYVDGGDFIEFSRAEGADNDRLNEEKRRFSQLVERRTGRRGPDNMPLIENWCPSEKTRRRILRLLDNRDQKRAVSLNSGGFYSFLADRGWFND